MSKKDKTDNTQPSDLLDYIRDNGGRVYQPTGNEGRPIAARWFKARGRSDKFCENVEKSSTWRTHPGTLKTAGYLLQEDGWWSLTDKKWIGLPKPIDSLKQIMDLIRPLMLASEAGKVDEFLLLRAQILQNTEHTKDGFLALKHPTAYGCPIPETYGDGRRTCLFHPTDEKLLLPEGSYTYADTFVLPVELNAAYSYVNGGRPEGMSIVPVRIVVPLDQMTGVTRYKVLIHLPERYDSEFVTKYHESEFDVVNLGLKLNLLRLRNVEARNAIAPFTNQLSALATKKQEDDFAISLKTKGE